MEINTSMTAKIVKETMGAQLVQQTLDLAGKTGSGRKASFQMQTKVLGAAMAPSEAVKTELGKGLKLDVIA